MSGAYTYSSGIEFLETAVHQQNTRFQLLVTEMRQFGPKSDIEMRIRLEHAHSQIRERNSEQKWLSFIDGQVESWKNPSLQFSHEFSERFASEGITSILLSAALCEATINAVLAIGLLTTKRAELFQMIERNEVKQKWLLGPKLFAEDYLIPKDGELFRNLDFVVKTRNSFMHHKIEISTSEPVERIGGSPRFSVPMNERGYKQIQDAMLLPYHLLDHLLKSIEDLSLKFSFENVLLKRTFR